jgi:mono/diheme cytochrome c family protein
MDWFLKWRGVIAPWNWVNFHAGEYRPDPNRSAQWNRGAYLVEGLGHCGQCHTPKGIFGGSKTSQALEGGSLPEGWYAPALAGDLRAGLGGWSEAEIAEYLKTGSTTKTAPAGPMSEVIAHSTSYMSDDDLAAIATSLKAMPAPGGAPQVQALGQEALARGQAVFIDNCAGCHMADGRGQPNAFPTLTGSSAIQARDPATLIRVVLEGQRIVTTPEKPTGLAMPAFRGKLDDQQVADVVNYIRNAWGNRGSLTDAHTIADARKSLAAARKLLESSRR